MEEINDININLVINEDSGKLLDPVSEDNELFNEQITNRYKHLAKRALQTSVIAFEVSTLNEASRYAALGMAYNMSGGNPIISGLAFGISTFAIEGSAAFVASDILDGDGSKRTIDKMRGVISKIMPSLEDKEDLSLPSQTALAMLGGSAVLLGTKQLVDPSRQKNENINFGIKTASLMGLYFTAEGILTSEMVDSFGWPKTAAGILLGLAGVQTIYKKIANKNSMNKDNQNSSLEFYNQFQDKNNDILRVGLFGKDLEKSLNNSETKFIKYKEKNKKIKIPVLTPIDGLEWFNQDLMKKVYGSTEKILVYTHPPFETEKSKTKISELLKAQIEKGNIILTERYTHDDKSPISLLIGESIDKEDYELIYFGDDEKSRVDFFAGQVKLKDNQGEINKSISFYEAYNEAIKNGEFKNDLLNGPSISLEVVGEEAEHIVSLYKEPFDELGQNDPTLAGFDDDSLREILSDKSVTKFINRNNGKIVSLMFFIDDFNQAPWFNGEEFKKSFPEYFETKNILIFPGIVTDKSEQGNRYATELVDFAVSIFEKRKTDVLITFECTQKSTKYVPHLVKAAIENSGIAKIDGLDEPKGSVEYVGIRKIVK